MSVLVGDDARVVLGDARALDAMESAWQASTLRCGFSHPRFIRSWYAHYRDAYEPVLCLQREATAGTPYVALALERRTGTITGAGAWQAEYHAAYCGPERDACVASSIRHAISETRAVRLALRFVESESTARDLQRELQRDMLVDCQAVLRPLRQLGTVSEESSALKKPGTRRKVRKLERQGVVAFETVRDATVLTETLALLADWYDLRIAGLGGGKPFREDPRKAAWFADAMEASPSMHVSRLMVGADPVAMHIGVRSADRVALGVLAYDARQAGSSPATLLLHHLFAELIDSGVTSFDLTPHGAYKDRFANAQDSVHVLDAIVKPRVRTRLAKLARRQLSATARAHPQVSARVRSGVERIRTHGVMESLRHVARQVRTEDRCLVFEHPLMTPTLATGILADPRELLRRWLTLDLPAGIQPRGAPSMRSILLAFERGNLPLGVVEHDQLVAWGWIGRRESQADWYWPVVPTTHPQLVVLCDEFITCGVDYRTAALQLHAARLRLPTTAAPTTHACLVIAAGDGRAVDAAMAADFTLLGVAERRVRWGRTTTAWRWTR